ncbi:MAG: hypothetical protein JXA44_04045 [Methanospirillaceae archaeon]|nr:hypothetical protein [Methanospirillaceae archaeon]
MADRKYLDPVITSFREERSLRNFADHLIEELYHTIPGYEKHGYGMYFRMGVLSEARWAAENNLLSPSLQEEYSEIFRQDFEYLKRTEREPVVQAICIETDPVLLDIINQLGLSRVREYAKWHTTDNRPDSLADIPDNRSADTALIDEYLHSVSSVPKTHIDMTDIRRWLEGL